MISDKIITASDLIIKSADARFQSPIINATHIPTAHMREVIYENERYMTSMKNIDDWEIEDRTKNAGEQQFNLRFKKSINPLFTFFGQHIPEEDENVAKIISNLLEEQTIYDLKDRSIISEQDEINLKQAEEFWEGYTEENVSSSTKEYFSLLKNNLYRQYDYSKEFMRTGRIVQINNIPEPGEIITVEDFIDEEVEEEFEEPEADDWFSKILKYTWDPIVGHFKGHITDELGKILEKIGDNYETGKNKIKDAWNSIGDYESMDWNEVRDIIPKQADRSHLTIKPLGSHLSKNKRGGIHVGQLNNKRSLAVEYLLKSGTDFMKNMYDAMIIFNNDNDPFFDLRVLMVRISSINIPQMESDVFDWKVGYTTIKKVRSKVKYERKAEIRILLDDPLFYYNKFNELGGNSIEGSNAESNLERHRPINSNMAITENITSNMKMTIIVKHQSLTDIRNQGLGHSDTWTGHTGMREAPAINNKPTSSLVFGPVSNEMPLWVFENVRFIGTTDSLSFSREDASTQEMNYQFIFKRCIQINRLFDSILEHRWSENNHDFYSQSNQEWYYKNPESRPSSADLIRIITGATTAEYKESRKRNRDILKSRMTPNEKGKNKRTFSNREIRQLLRDWDGNPNQPWNDDEDMRTMSDEIQHRIENDEGVAAAREREAERARMEAMR